MIFTDEIKPAAAEVINVDADGDGGVVAWTENDGTVMKVSTQIKGIKVQAAVYSNSMFVYKGKIRKIDLKMLDTSNVTDMSRMFEYCSRLTSLNLSQFNTQKVTYMGNMFSDCSSLTTLITGPNFKFVGTTYYLSGTWQNTAGATFNGNYDTANFPSNVADTYTKISD